MVHGADFGNHWLTILHCIFKELKSILLTTNMVSSMKTNRNAENSFITGTSWLSIPRNSKPITKVATYHCLKLVCGEVESVLVGRVDPENVPTFMEINLFTYDFVMLSEKTAERFANKRFKRL